MIGINDKLNAAYIKFNSSANTAFVSGKEDYAINAGNDFWAFDQRYGNIKDSIDVYEESLKNSRALSDSVAKAVWEILPWDLSGKVFKEENQPEDNIKMLFKDPVVILFLIAMIGAAVYYFIGIDWEEYDDYDDYYEEPYPRRPAQRFPDARRADPRKVPHPSAPAP